MSDPLQRLKFFCLTHQESCQAQRVAPLPKCEQGAHLITEDFLRDKWEYCCACESFFERRDQEPTRLCCPSCNRIIVARYLCHSCDTLSFDARFEAEPRQSRRNFFFSSTGVPKPYCPCCTIAPDESQRVHYCIALGCNLRTSRQNCPLCDWEELEGSSSQMTTAILISTEGSKPEKNLPEPKASSEELFLSDSVEKAL